MFFFNYSLTGFREEADTASQMSVFHSLRRLWPSRLKGGGEG
jgi:hypothetical protein